jgi:hypothetical protein
MLFRLISRNGPSRKSIGRCLVLLFVAIFATLSSLRQATVEHWGDQLITLLLLFNVLYAYLRTMFTNPGYVEPALALDDDIVGARFCLLCQVLKDRDTHHCTVCIRCVQSMDHHCLWVGNCVGRRNRGYFIAFLHWCCVALWYCSIMSATATKGDDELVLISSMIQVELCFILHTGMAIIMTCFMSWNWYLLLTNQTTVSYRSRY